METSGSFGMNKRSTSGMGILGIAAGALLALGSITSANAAIVNGGFEDFPDFSGWVTSGSNTIQAADFHAPFEGQQQALMSTAPSGGGNPVTAAALETFVGLSSGQLSTDHSATNGSAICQMFTATDGQVLTVHFDFLTNENPVRVLSGQVAASDIS